MDVRGVAALYSFVNAGMSDCLAFRQSGNGTEKNSDAGTSPVPEWGDPVWHQNAPVPNEMSDIGMHADAQLDFPAVKIIKDDVWEPLSTVYVIRRAS